MVKKEKIKEIKDWHVLEFYAPINESVSTSGKFIIRGPAINETTTRNGVTYVAEELEMAAPSFRNKPILLDHVNSVKNIVGRTTENVSYDSNKKAIMFEANIMDKEIQQMIKDGRITNVSIGAKVQDLVDDKENGIIKAVGIEGLEISMVAVPGDPGAGIASALWESYELKKKVEEDYITDDEEEEEKEDENKDNCDEEKTKITNQIIEKEVINMTEESTQITEQVQVAPVAEQAKVEVVEEKKEIKTFDFEASMKAMNESLIASMKSVKEDIMKAVDEKLKVEVKTESVNPSVSVIETKKVDETKGIVASKTNTEEEMDSDIVYEQADTGRGFQIWRNYTDTSKFKRLAR